MNDQKSTIIFDLDGTKPQFSMSHGSKTVMNADNFPALKGMGAILLRLERGGVLEPHWHPNAAELNYCISGQAKMTIYSNNARKETILINPGQLTFVPRGCWHHIENIGENELKIVIVYDNEHFEDLGISGSVGSLPTRILNSIFGINSPGLFDQLGDVPSQDVVFGKKAINNSKSNSNNESESSNSYTLNLSDTTAQVQTPGGTAVLGSIPYFPILKGLSVFLLNLRPKGIVEPHTHPNAGELNYVIEGKARFTVYGPNKNTETSEIGKGKVFFVPAGYFHYLENSDDGNNSIIASFFGNESPEFIGLVGGLSSYSDEVLGAVFNTDQKIFSNLPRLVKNVLIAPGTN